MENQKTVSDVINAEIMDLSVELEDAYAKLGKVSMSIAPDWKVKAAREKECTMLEGQVAILNKILDKINSLSIDLPKTAAV